MPLIQPTIEILMSFLQLMMKWTDAVILCIFPFGHNAFWLRVFLSHRFDPPELHCIIETKRQYFGPQCKWKCKCLMTIKLCRLITYRIIFCLNHSCSFLKKQTKKKSLIYIMANKLIYPIYRNDPILFTDTESNIKSRVGITFLCRL